MDAWSVGIFILVILYIAVCFGKIAAKNGKNPILFVSLSVISPINLIILGIWAFSKEKNTQPCG